MKTSIIEVAGMLSALSVEKQLTKLPGIEKTGVNCVGGSAAVVYDDKIIGLKEIKAGVQECGYHCSGESLPKHVCQAGADQ